MKITRFECFHVKPRWLFLKVSTDEGLVGWGEPIVEGRARTVAAAIAELEPALIGSDPFRIEALWQRMYRGTFYRGGPILTSAISGIEQALWDIKGKYYGMPAYEMLGGRVRDRIRMYGHVRTYGDSGGVTWDDMIASARSRKEAGYTAIKYAPAAPIRHIDTQAFVEAEVKRFVSLREVVGKDVDIAVDFHGRVSPAMSVRLAKALEPHYPMFIEEPCLPDNTEEMAMVARSTSVPIAAGERKFTRWGFRQLFEKQAIAVAQPDACHAGGIFELRKIAAMAEVYGIAFAPHNPLGPISLASCIQLDACTPNFLIQEFPAMESGADLGVGLLKVPFRLEGGYIDVPVGPGLGIEVDEDLVRASAYDGAWDTPHVEYEDGSLAEW
jgi:galactonate dehydratase